MLNRRQSQTGLTLVELLVALVASLVVIAGATSIYLNSIRLENDNINLARLTQDMRSMMDVMVRDIRRSGFVSSDPIRNLADLRDNPFSRDDNDIHVWGGSCIVFAYNRDDDTNGDGVSDEVPPVIDPDEYLGFRLNNVGQVEMRQGGTSNKSCNNNNDVRVALSSPMLTVTALSFSTEISTVNASSMIIDSDSDGCMDGDDESPNSFSSTCASGHYGNGVCDASEGCTVCVRNGSPDPACLVVRAVTISLSAEVSGVPGLAQNITQRVRLRNDQFLRALP